MAYAVLFPGQGSQAVGMGADLFDARPDLLGDAADDALGWSLRTVCLHGPESELTRTDRAQPALYALAYALWDTLAPQLAAPPAGAAGHSLGEYTALAAAGAVDFATGLRLVAARGEAMARAAEATPSGMAALLGIDVDAADTITAERRAAGGALWVANVNDPSQVVVAGSAADIEWVTANARDLGVRRAVPLQVAGAFHSPYMQPAADSLGEALAGVDFRPPRFPVYGNASAAPLPAAPADELASQLTARVRFKETLENMASAGIDTFVHVGPGNVTAGMARRSVPGATVLTVSDPAGIADAVASLLAA